MDLSKLGLFRLVTARLNWLNQRQDIVSQNIANADTPEYQSRDIEPFTFRSALRGAHQLEPLRSEPAHMTGSLPSQPSGRVDKEQKPYETAPDGNGVILEEQLMKVAQNNMDYQLATNIYRKQVDLLKTAIGHGS